MRNTFHTLGIFVLALVAALVGPVRAQDAGGSADKTAELLAKIKADGDRTKEDVLTQLGGERSMRALEGLLEAYDIFQTTYMKREVIRALRLFDGVPECERKAMQRLTDEATSSPERELRDAAVDSLGSCTLAGKYWLELIVKSPADDGVRERALKAHIGLSTEADHAWYRLIWKPKKAEDEDEKDKSGKLKNKRVPKKDEKDGEEEAKPRTGIVLNSMRLLAFDALVGKLTIDELKGAVTNEGFAKIRKSALEELAQRVDPSTHELAWKVVKHDNEQAENRVVAARIVARIDGTKCAPEFIKRAMRVDVPVELRRGLAEILVAFNDPDVNKALLAEMGRGKAHEKLFQMYSVRSLQDERVDKALLKMLSDKEPEVVVGAAKILGERRAKEAAPALAKLFEKTKDKDIRRATLDAIAIIRVGDHAWVEELVALTKSEDPEIRNLALSQLGLTADRTHLERLIAALSDPNWSTRLAALEALERMRTHEGVTAMVARMGQEEGRMLSEFAQALWRLTGQSFQEDAKAWEAWWSASKDNFQLLSANDLGKVESGAEEWRLRQTTRVKSEFFGIKIVSRKVIFIVDISGSMEEKLTNDYQGKSDWTRMQVAKAELKKCLEKLDPGAFFNLILFSSGVERWADSALVPCDDKHRAEALAYVDKLLAGGGTNLYDSLVDAFKDPDVDTIFVMSDGEPSMGDVTEPVVIREHVASWNENRRIVINTIAVGGQFSILEWLAEDSGGTHVKFE